MQRKADDSGSIIYAVLCRSFGGNAMQRSWLKFGLVALLLVLTEIHWKSIVWASTYHSPAHQAILTQVITDTPMVPTSTTPTDIPEVVPATSVLKHA
jgi:hypothetical protein